MIFNESRKYFMRIINVGYSSFNNKILMRVIFAECKLFANNNKIQFTLYEDTMAGYAYLDICGI